MVNPFFTRRKNSVIKPCPICGKQPKIKDTIWDCGTNRMIEIKCKPLFGELHCSTINCGSVPWVHMDHAIDAWNRKVMYIERHKNA